eukprot:TRINITY_DN6303_c1_g1_i1.p1 TRINITY_DN6303_c1_g1~~TRINITY_DN6303_c1_g1_i1.p1  ORF type:complete len:106 (-),score=6.40 TRINITY_DN6303_c1_g1_i1:164-481(-)
MLTKHSAAIIKHKIKVLERRKEGIVADWQTIEIKKETTLIHCHSKLLHKQRTRVGQSQAGLRKHSQIADVHVQPCFHSSEFHPISAHPPILGKGVLPQTQKTFER